MGTSIVVYASRYGSTREVATAIAAGLGADVASVLDRPDISGHDLVVLGSPIYSGAYLPGMQRFVQQRARVLANKKVAAFVLAAAAVQGAFAPGAAQVDADCSQDDLALALARLAGGAIVGARGFGGRITVEQLDPPDRAALEWMHQFLLRRPLEGFDLTDTDAARRWGVELRATLSA